VFRDTKFHFLDVVVFLLAAGLTVFCAVRVYGGGGQAELYIQGKDGRWVYPLQAESGPQQVEIPGLLGSTVVELSGVGARVLSSPCTNKNCVSSGMIHRRGEWIACLPNGVSLTIEGSGADLDAAVW
jgi:hypothetical protein